MFTSSSHFLIFTSSHLHMFTSSSHLLICTSSHLLIFTSSHLIFTFSHLLIFTSSHLHSFSSSHLHILTSSHLHICTTSHSFSLFLSSSYLLIFTSSYLLSLSLCVSCSLSRSLSFLFFSLLRPHAVPTRRPPALPSFYLRADSHRRLRRITWPSVIAGWAWKLLNEDLLLQKYIPYAFLIMFMESWNCIIFLEQVGKACSRKLLRRVFPKELLPISHSTSCKSTSV